MLQIDFSPEEVAAIKAELCRGASDDQVTLFLAECKRRNLVPGTHLFFQLRNAKEWSYELNAQVKVKKATWITKIDAMRLIANRTGEFQGQRPTQFIYLDDQNQPSEVSEIPLPDKNNPRLPREPWACRVSVLRKGFTEPFTATCRFDAYAVTRNTDSGPVLTEMWQRRGPEQLEKCATVAALKGAFPEELGSLYISEEFERDQAAFTEHEQPTAAPAPAAPIVPAVNHAPAQPTNEPRPGETTPVQPGSIPPVDPELTQALEDSRTKRTRKPKPDPTVEVGGNPLSGFQATDDDLPPEMFEPTSPENGQTAIPMTKKDIAEKVRSYYSLAHKDDIQKFILAETGAATSGDIAPEKWAAVFAKLDAAAGDKATFSALVKGVA